MSARCDFDAETYVEQALAALGIAVELEWKPAIVANFRRAAEIAEAFLDFPLADEDEPAPIFVP